MVGKHDNAIRCVEYSTDMNCIITGSWDSTVKLWDTRSPRNIGSYTQPDKVIFYIFIKRDLMHYHLICCISCIAY